MPPYKYNVRLTSTEKRALRRLKRQAKTEARLADRARILLWAHAGVTVAETARRLECGREKVIFWRHRFLEGRSAKIPVLERLRDQPRSGRPASFSPAGPRDGRLGDVGAISNGTATERGHAVQQP
jgi:hypothetical protein